MTNLREAAQMALEALEDLQVYPACYMHGNIDKILKTQAKEEFDQSEDVIVALRAALAQPEQEPYCYTWDVWIRGGYWEAQYGWEPYCGGKRPEHSTEAKPLYTAPPQREWQGLTDEVRRKLWNAPENLERPMAFALAIEAKLKEENT